LALTSGSEAVYLDIDASLIEVHSENKVGATPNYKKGYGFHPMLCFADATGEALSAVLRPRNATANTVADHVRVLDGAIEQLPGQIASGHHVGDDEVLATRSVVVRADSAGCTTGFLAAARARHVGFFVTARSNTQVMNAVFDAVGCDVWLPATTQDGQLRDGAAVAELTSLIEHSTLPEGTRLIVRREPLHPGAQRSLIPSLEFRYWGFWTDQDGDPRELDATMRARVRREPHPTAEGLRSHRNAVHQLRRQRRVAIRGLPFRRPGALVPAALSQRSLAERATQDAALETVPRAGSTRAPQPPTHRARDRWLARDQGAHRLV
jgi:hypothetical protein